jgi:hypothetical protein
MAIKTGQFDRDDLYTLFITARIINFIKGINTGTEDSGLLESLEAAKGSDKRGAMGADILKRLFKEKRLYAATGIDMRVIDRFRTDLFFRVWKKLPHIFTQTGTRIDLQQPLSPSQ